MNNQNIFFILCLLLCFIAPIILCSLNSKNILNKIKLEASIIFLPIVCLSIYMSLFWSNSDFISGISALKFISPFIATIFFSTITLFSTQTLIHILCIIILSCFIVFGFNFTPQILPSQPIFINQLLLIVFWCFITLSIRILNVLSGIICCQLSVFCLGAYILSFIGCAPKILGFIALCTSFSSFVFTIKSWPPAPNLIKNKQADTIGFMLGAFIVNGSIESLTSPFLIFILFPLCEILLALLKKITLISTWENIYQNTSCSQALSSGLSPQVIANHFLRISILLLVIGCFQIFAPSQYSLLIISSIICCWQMYRLSNWQNLSSGWIDNNKKIKKEFQTNLSAIKQKLKNKEENK